MNIDDPVWDHSTFSFNRQRLFDEAIAQHFFEHTVLLARMRDLVSDEYFSVDGSLLEAWASHKSFRPKDDHDDGDGGDFRGLSRSNDTHASTTGPDARLIRKGTGPIKPRHAMPRRGRIPRPTMDGGLPLARILSAIRAGVRAISTSRPVARSSTTFAISGCRGSIGRRTSLGSDRHRVGPWLDLSHVCEAFRDQLAASHLQLNGELSGGLGSTLHLQIRQCRVAADPLQVFQSLLCTRRRQSCQARI